VTVPRRAVLHIDTERTWRGGENQLRMLVSHPDGSSWEWHVAAPPDSEAARRLAPYARVLSVRMRGARFVGAAVAVAGYVRAQGIPILDCQSSRAHGLGLMVKMLVPEVRLVVHRRVDYPPSPGVWSGWKYRTGRVDRYVCISSAIAEVMAAYGIDRQRLAVVRSAVDPMPFTALDREALRARLAREWNVPDGVPIIGNVAYLTRQKGHDTLIRALGILRTAGTPFFAYIAGDGPLRPELHALARSLGLTDRNLRFLGVRDDVPQLLGATDVFALTSNDEGLGTSLLDAAWAGCALVATAVGGIPEIVLDERTGLLAARGDAELVATQLGRLLRDTVLRARLVSEARAHATREFSWRAMVTGNLRVYEGLL
jgi:glycosyltransferase involved in cell wall biosynthesis